MFTFDIILDLSKTGYEPEIAEYLENLICCFSDAQQVIKTDCTFVHASNALRVSVGCPEADALDLKNCTAYGKHWVEQLENALQAPVQFIPTGADPRFEPYIGQENPSFYILYGNRYFPLFNGDANRFVPLYKIPFTYHDEACYNDVRFWNNNYERLYGLWFSGELQKFALRQMQDPHSVLSKQGRAVCQRIEAVTGVPTYYFLFNYRQRSLAQDRAWKCPLCGKNWLLEGAEPSDDLAFRCTDDRIVSAFTLNSALSPNRWESTKAEVEPPMTESARRAYVQQQMIEIYQSTLLKLSSDASNAKSHYDLSFCALFAGDYAKAIKSAQKALQLNPRMIEVEANLALAYMLNDQYDEAETVYLKWKGKKFKSVDRDTADKVFLSDIAELEDAGIEHRDFERVKRLFRE